MWPASYSPSPGEAETGSWMQKLKQRQLLHAVWLAPFGLIFRIPDTPPELHAQGMALPTTSCL